MWVVAGILLALVVLGFVAGFHFGPHAHIPAAAAGILAAVWLVAMAFLGQARPLLFVLLGADLTFTGLLGVGAVRVLRDPGAVADRNRPPDHLEGEFGVADSDLDPKGIVSLRGEQWSAESLNGRVAAGTSVQVIRVDGVRLEVWGDSSDALPDPTDLATPPTDEETRS
jgi:membrane protein implicated in regulation of membrane protease activity